MFTHPTCLIAFVVLCALLAKPAASQSVDAYSFRGHVEPLVEGSPTDFLPLAVGNQWTYEHVYSNGAYIEPFYYYHESDHMRSAMQAILEIPGYPLYEENIEPPLDLAYNHPGRELTIKITHTETIADHEYFVFSRPEYAWPPVPNLFLAGQKVRFSAEGTLLVRWQEQDVPLYRLPQPTVWDGNQPFNYTLGAYPLLYDGNSPTSLRIYRDFWDTEVLPEDGHPDYLLNLSATMGPGFVACFQVSATHEEYVYGSIDLGRLYFLTDYGLAFYTLFYLGNLGPGTFMNALRPVSAVIDGEEIAHPHVILPIETPVQPSSWGRVKALGRRP